MSLKQTSSDLSKKKNVIQFGRKKVAKFIQKIYKKKRKSDKNVWKLKGKKKRGTNIVFEYKIRLSLKKKRY